MRRRSGVRVLGVSVCCALVGATAGCGRSTATDAGVPTVGGEAPPLADYSHIPLPTSAPPPGAIVHAVSFADPSASGQDIAFQYQGFTIQACWRQISLSDTDACLPQQGDSIFRTLKSQDAETLFTVSTKNFAALPEGAATAVQFFKSSELAPRPSGRPDYVASEFGKLVGEGAPPAGGVRVCAWQSPPPCRSP